MEETRIAINPSTGKYNHVTRNILTGIRGDRILYTGMADELIRAEKRLEILRAYVELINSDPEFREHECFNGGYSDIPDGGGSEEYLARFNLSAEDVCLIKEIGGAGFYACKAVEKFRKSESSGKICQKE